MRGSAIALVPAAGRGTRLQPMAPPTSKEVLPLVPDAPTTLERFLRMVAAAGVGHAVILVRAGKHDILEVVGSGRRHGVDVAFRVLEHTDSVPETLAAAAPFVADRPVLLGFPDILYEPEDAFVPLLARLEEREPDVVLGLFPTERADKSDMVEVDRDGRVRRISIKSDRRDLEWAWGLAAWSPRFTTLLERVVSGQAGAEISPSVEGELQIGDVVQLAVESGWRVESVSFPDGLFVDIGTPDDLRRARALLGP